MLFIISLARDNRAIPTKKRRETYCLASINLWASPNALTK